MASTASRHLPAHTCLPAWPCRLELQLELDLQAPGLLSRLAGLVPGLAQQLSLLTAWQRLVTSLLDDAAAFLAALVAYHQLPALAAGWAEGGVAS